MLDFGCGTQPYRALLERHFTHYLGADLAANPLAEIQIRDDGTLARDDASVDTVLSTEVLEHVALPADYLREAWRVLRPGGSLILSTPGMFVYHITETIADYRRWTPVGLRFEIERAGFEVVRMESALSGLSYAVQLWQDSSHHLVRPLVLRRAYYFVCQRIVHAIERLRRFQFSYNACSYVVLARRRP